MEFAKYLQHAFAFSLMAVFSLAGPACSKPNHPSSHAIQTPETSAVASAPGAKQIVPQDAKALLLVAAQVNGLDAPGLRPWHILVTYDKFDEDGDNVDSGTYEEFWVGAKQYRLSYSSHDFTQTDIATEKGLFRTGNEKWPGELQTRVRDEFVRPMFREMNLQYANAEKTTHEFGKVQLPCVLLRQPSRGIMIVSISGLPSFCFESDSLMLRYIKGGMSPTTIWDQTVYDKIVRFQDRYVGSDIQVMRGGKLYLKLHLEKLELISQPNAVDFTPDLNARAVDEKRINLDASVLSLDYVLHEELPQYPKSIHAPGGTATMKYIVGKDGHVTSVQFIEGTAEMKKGLEEALKKYVYRPFVVRGEPVEVEVDQKFIYEIRSR